MLPGKGNLSMHTRLLTLFLLILSALASAAALAHKSSDGFLYLDMDVAGAGGRLDIALIDLSREVPLDADSDARVTWGELQAAMPTVQRRLAADIHFTRGGTACVLDWSARGIARHSDGAYLSLNFKPECGGAAEGRDGLEYNLFFEEDPLHRLLVMVRENGTDRLSVLGPDARTLRLDRAPSTWETAGRFLWEGMVHLWIGYDHMLFLLALVLPAAVRREHGRWVVEDRFGAAVKDVALIVTAFTLAHSVTLVIATLGWVQLNIDWVETLIALSIVAAAINVIWPFLGRRRYLMGFGFGLIHGFGFASVLSDFMAGTADRAVALLSFNLGVELAQLAVVMLTVPLIFLVRRQRLYRNLVLPSAITAIAAIGLVWVVERVPV